MEGGEGMGGRGWGGGEGRVNSRVNNTTVLDSSTTTCSRTNSLLERLTRQRLQLLTAELFTTVGQRGLLPLVICLDESRVAACCVLSGWVGLLPVVLPETFRTNA